MDRGFNARESAAKPRANCVYAIQIPRVPTILAVGYEEGFAGLVEAPRLDGYLVLLVSNFDDALHIIKTHSSPIHVLVTYASANAPDWTTIVKPFRLDEIPIVRVLGKLDVACVLMEERVPVSASPGELPQHNGRMRAGFV